MVQGVDAWYRVPTRGTGCRRGYRVPMRCFCGIQFQNAVNDKEGLQMGHLTRLASLQSLRSLRALGPYGAPVLQLASCTSSQHMFTHTSCSNGVLSPATGPIWSVIIGTLTTNPFMPRGIWSWTHTSKTGPNQPPGAMSHTLSPKLGSDHAEHLIGDGVPGQHGMSSLALK